MVPVLAPGWGWWTRSCGSCPTPAWVTSASTATRRPTSPSEYYERLPPLEDAFVFVVDPMLATGGSAVHASTA